MSDPAGAQEYTNVDEARRAFADSIARIFALEPWERELLDALAVPGPPGSYALAREEAGEERRRFLDDLRAQTVATYRGLGFGVEERDDGSLVVTPPAAFREALEARIVAGDPDAEPVGLLELPPAPSSD